MYSLYIKLYIFLWLDGKFLAQQGGMYSVFFYFWTNGMIFNDVFWGISFSIDLVETAMTNNNNGI